MLRLTATSVLALGLGAAPVLADLTPAEVWENLRQYGAENGYEVTAEVEDTGNTLTLRDAVFATTGDDGGSMRLTFPQMTLSQTGDARVRVVVEGDVAIANTVMTPPPAPALPPSETPSEAPGAAPAPADPAEVVINGTISVPGNEMVVSGTPEDMLYEYTYPTLNLVMDVPVGPQGDATLPFTAELTDLAGSQRNVASDGMASTFDMALAQAALRIAGRVPVSPSEGAADTPPQDSPPQPDTAEDGAAGTGAAESGATEDGSVDVQVRLSEVTARGSSATPGRPAEDGTQLTEALSDGMTVDATVAYQALEGSFAMSGRNEAGENQTGNGTFGTGPSDLRVQLSANGMGYAGSTADTRVEMTMSDLPFPVGFAAERTSADIQLPVLRADSAQPFRLAYALEGVTLADAIWGLFDPTAQLPRDPASLVMDLEGDAIVTGNLFDPEAAQAQVDDSGAVVPPAPPFVPQTVTVNRVALDAAGASAEITGALEFGDDPAQPVGRLNGSFEGVNGLMDTLVTMGLVPQEQMMGLRMMLTMFARPAEDNPDRLTSEIEFREGGTIFANGQQVR